MWVDIDCGFGIWTRQKLRLRGIDAPEMDTAEGREARDFVVRALGKGRRLRAEGERKGRGSRWWDVVVTTTKPDKYDRYLADVFYVQPGTVKRAV